ncbi:protocadherin Fat 1-like [Dreissena polymorpha]|uniref:protocadherin Fat 1-like n=1 Tax=Dreissena polymorpha TaxID=45954 RepID=UPI0022642F47|nr:protocadherin Fat 1-like [Dreissena polymorpha]
MKTPFLMDCIGMIVSLVLIRSTVHSVDPINSFTQPTTGVPCSCPENTTTNTGILACRVALSEYSGYNVTIQSQVPSHPPFQLEKNNLEWILKTPLYEQIDRETISNFTFKFNATNGMSSITSGILTLIITDINDNSPKFTNDSHEYTIYNSLTSGTFPLTIQATDADEKPTITYSISAGNTGNTFSIDPKTGQLTPTTPCNPNATIASTYNFTVQASDGTHVTDTTVIIHVVDDPCVPSPCANSGTCRRNQTDFNCTCAAGWLGDRRNHTDFNCTCATGWLGDTCGEADPCFPNPCKNGGVCAVNGMNFTCSCTTGFHGSNCTVAVPTTSAPCIYKSCGNGGTCIAVGTSFSCLCVSGMTGNTCSTTDATIVSQTDSQESSRNALLPVFIVVPIIVVVIVVAAIVIYKHKRPKVDPQDGPRNRKFERSQVTNLIQPITP